MSKYVFIVPSLSDSHYKNRIIEFLEHGLDVKVYGFGRASKKEVDLPYEYETLGMLHDNSYKDRINLYLKSFAKFRQIYNKQDVVFYLGGLDIAMFFHYLNPSFRYIFEECDLTHTYLGRLKGVLEWIDKKIIKKSLLTVTTSEGFIKYHFNGIKPDNVFLIENKLNPAILDVEAKDNKSFCKDKVSIGFVGGPRFDSVYNFIDVFCKRFPNGSFHVYGGPITAQFDKLRKHNNCIFHGFFKNPTDLPEIYSTIDVVVATYDVKFENVRYAEPNKIYEAIYFETPIVVSSGTFLAEKVNKLGIGYDINAMDENEIVEFINSLSADSIQEKICNARKIDKKDTLNFNDAFFEKLNSIV